MLIHKSLLSEYCLFSKWTKCDKNWAVPEYERHFNDISFIKPLKNEQTQNFRSHSQSYLKLVDRWVTAKRDASSLISWKIFSAQFHNTGGRIYVHACTLTYTQAQVHNIETTSLRGRISSNLICQLIFSNCCLHGKHSPEVTYGLTSRPDD